MRRSPQKIFATLTDAVRAPEGGTCSICGAPLGAEQHIITELPDGEHIACREQRLSGTTFPYDEQVDSLRLLAVILKRQYNLVVHTGKWIAAVSRGWPKTRGIFETDRVERMRKLKSGITILHAELGKFGRRNWF